MADSSAATDTQGKSGGLDPKSIQKKTPEMIPEGSPWNQTEELFLKRRSVRKYKRKQVPEHYIKRILEVARYAPSQGNSQPWRFVVVRDRDMIQEMEEFVLKQFSKLQSVPKGVEVPGWHPIPLGLLRDSPPETGIKVFHGAPTLIFPLMDKRGIGHAKIDLGIVGTNIVMAAVSLGLGTCWVGFAEALKGSEWPKRLGIEEPYELLEAICVGYALGHVQTNFVHRETHRTLWFENGKKRSMY